MSSKKFKYSEKFPNEESSIITEFLNLNISKLVSSIQGSSQAKQILEKIEFLKSEVEDKLKESFVKESKRRVNTKEEDFVDFYRNQLTLIKYKDEPKQKIKYNMQIRIVKAEFQLGKGKQVLVLDIYHTDEDGDKTVYASLSYKTTDKKFEEIWDWTEEENFQFNSVLATTFMNNSKFDEVDTRDVKFSIKDLTLAMIKFLEDKYGEQDANDMTYGIEEDDIDMILNI